MARKPYNPATAATEARARLKSLNIAKASKTPNVAIVKNAGVRQPAANMSTAQKTRLANMHAQVRAFIGK